MKRVFKTKTFDRWARKVVADDLLCQAAHEIEQGQYEADLGGGVCKKRVAVKKLDGLVATDVLKEICNVKQKSD